MTEAEEKAVEYLKANSLVRLSENNEVVAYGNAHKYYIINLIEKLQKENEELKEKQLIDRAMIEDSISKGIVERDYIPKDKIKEKIKELEQQKDLFFEKTIIQGRIDLLKELLEEE